MAGKAELLDAVVTAAFVVVGILILSWLEEIPFPKAGAAISFLNTDRLNDVKFYAPPLGAIAILVFNAKSLPALKQMCLGILGSCLGAFVLVSFLGATSLTRALSCGLSLLFMKIFCPAVFAPAGALAVLFVDNAKMRELGVYYCLMPGLSGAMVLVLLAAAKIWLIKALRPLLKRFDPKGELTVALLASK